MATKEELEVIINNPENDQIIIDEAKKELDKINQMESIEQGEISTDDAQGILNQLSNAIEQATTNITTSDDQIRDIIADELSETKIGLKNLQPSVIDLIGRSQSVTLVNFQNKVVRSLIVS